MCVFNGNFPVDLPTSISLTYTLRLPIWIALFFIDLYTLLEIARTRED